MRAAALLAAGLAFSAALALAACSGSGPNPAAGRKCPVPVRYSKEQYDEIQKALKDLPKDSILHQTMQDYEEERDALRFCK